MSKAVGANSTGSDVVASAAGKAYRALDVCDQQLCDVRHLANTLIALGADADPDMIATIAAKIREAAGAAQRERLSAAAFLHGLAFREPLAA